MKQYCIRRLDVYALVGDKATWDPYFAVLSASTICVGVRVDVGVGVDVATCYYIEQ